MNPKKVSKATASEFTVFISNLSHDIQLASLQSYVALRFNGSKLKQNSIKAKNKFRSAVLMLKSKDDYDRILNEPFLVNHLPCTVSPYIDEARRLEQMESKVARRVFLNHLPEDVTKEELAPVYAAFGEYQELYLKEVFDSRFETKYSFATFTAQESTARCLLSSTPSFLRGQKLEFISFKDFQSMLDARRNEKQIRKQERALKKGGGAMPVANKKQQKPAADSNAKQSKLQQRKSLDSSQEVRSEIITDVLRAEETRELKIKYLITGSIERPDEYQFNRVCSELSGSFRANHPSSHYRYTQAQH